MKCDKCGTESKGVILDHFGRPVKTGDCILLLLPLLHHVIYVEGAEIKLKEPLVGLIPAALVVEEIEYCPLDSEGQWEMFVRGYHCGGIRSKVSRTLTGQNNKPHPDIYQLGAEIPEVF